MANSQPTAPKPSPGLQEKGEAASESRTESVSGSRFSASQEEGRTGLPSVPPPGLLTSKQTESVKGESNKVAVLATAELPAKSVDLAAINLTELVNGMLNTALKGSKKFFSLLSITSYSSYAFHKVSIVIYNISNLKNIDPTKFPMRYCYCLNNRTNDLTDFTALLVDIVGNSTDSLKEIFKSTSIVSVSQGNDTDCIYICVMSGRTGRNLSDLWEAIEKSPFINYTFSGNVSDLLAPGIPAQPWTVAAKGVEASSLPFTMWQQTPGLKGAEVSSFQESSRLQTDAAKEWAVLPTAMASSLPPLSYGILPGTQPVPRCPQTMKKGTSMTTPYITAQKINPCVMELCKFFHQCLCARDRSYSRDEAMRYCIENYSWFLKNATYICEKVKRTAHSRTLKQKCLASICKAI
ncbi:HERV-H LTR-associating protein 1 [Zootoca vivipara]|uniref:HERV-H LTR-associating protein 1 n=1 Tax=Zootoca vivipara TaxID=8524 RepID=UPI00293BB348|nr:HERV-H LTR-associating protein 1 [Zootoca vivipara]